MKWRKRFTCGIIFVLMLAVLLGSIPVGATEEASSDEIRAELDALQEEEAALQEQIDALESQMKENLGQLTEIVEQKNLIDQQIILLHEQLCNTNEQISACALLIADKQEELDDAQRQFAALTEKHKARIRAMEEEGDLSYWSILFQANSFLDLLDRMDMIEEIAAADRQRLKALNDAAERVALARNALAAEKEMLEQAKQDLSNSEKLLDEKRQEADSLLRELLAMGREYELLLDEAELKQDQLMQEIAQKENAYDDALYREWLATQKPQTVPPAGNSQWLTPVESYVLTSPFGMRKHPILGGDRMHNGIDMACPAMTPIYASRSGVVSVASYQADGAGNYVQLDHGDGYRSIYMHMTYYIVSVGEYVQQGQVIGYVGNTGLSKGNHLHFGISRNGEYVNPMEYIG